jgi:short subunit dehydrogenase-like uncharacterized protein
VSFTRAPYARVMRDLDLVVFGATGYVGRLVAGYLARHPDADRVRVGLGGRSRQKLARVRADLGPVAADWPLLVADVHDAAAVHEMVGRTRVVASTVGPYSRYGLPLLEACVAAGTDYADLTGEALFVRDGIDRFHEAAAAAGVRLVHSCGFDSVPSDLGVFALAERARADREGELTDTTLVVRSARGGFSGGTVDSLRAQIEAVRGEPSLQATLEDPYCLSPDRSAEPDTGSAPDTSPARRDGDLGTWVGPFVMASYNTRIVRRSNALQGWAYGRRFRYREVVGFGTGPLAGVLAAATGAGLRVVTAASALPPVQRVLDRVLPSPGEGPSEATRAHGYFRVDIHTRTTTGARYVATIAAQGDPGYAATSVMLAESALCLAEDGDRLPERAGSLTPATAMGDALVDRLRRAGFQFTVGRR